MNDILSETVIGNICGKENLSHISHCFRTGEFLGKHWRKRCSQHGQVILSMKIKSFSFSWLYLIYLLGKHRVKQVYSSTSRLSSFHVIRFLLKLEIVMHNTICTRKSNIWWVFYEKRKTLSHVLLQCLSFMPEPIIRYWTNSRQFNQVIRVILHIHKIELTKTNYFFQIFLKDGQWRRKMNKSTHSIWYLTTGSIIDAVHWETYKCIVYKRFDWFSETYNRCMWWMSL